MDKQKLMEVVKGSEEVELNEEGTLIRRKDNRSVPELMGQDVKTKKVKQISNDIMGIVYSINPV